MSIQLPWKDKLESSFFRSTFQCTLSDMDRRTEERLTQQFTARESTPAKLLGMEASCTVYVKRAQCCAGWICKDNPELSKEQRDHGLHEAQLSCRDLCLRISKPLEKLAELSGVPAGTSNKSNFRAKAIRWNNLRERKRACPSVYTWPSTKAPWTTPKDMTNAQNNEE